MQCLFKKVFSIEGNIGAGKSTLLSLLEKNIPNCKIIPEPVGEWKNVGGKNLLSAFYEQTSRWCFTFEINSMFSLVTTLQDALQSDAEIILIERSLFSNRAFHHISSNHHNSSYYLRGQKQIGEPQGYSRIRGIDHIGGVALFQRVRFQRWGRLSHSFALRAL